MAPFYQTANVKLSGDKPMPLFGLGTWLSKPGEVEHAVKAALDDGYKLLDCAAIYKNEPEVGKAIKEWIAEGGKREDIFVTSKLWNNSQAPAHVEAALDKTLADLGLDYLDLYLQHWPSAFVHGKDMIPKDASGLAERDLQVTNADTWAAMERLLETGKVRNIGISNFTRSEVENLLKTAKHDPDVIQLELHPYLSQREYCQWLQSKGIAITAYSPFGNLNPNYNDKAQKIVDTDVVKELAKKYSAKPSCVVLSWGIAHKYSVIPKTVNTGRVKENRDVFEMAKEDVEKIDALNCGHFSCKIRRQTLICASKANTRYNDPSTSFGYVFFADEKPAGTTAVHAFSNAASRATGAVKQAVGQA